MTDAPKHPESLSRRDMIAATAAALVTPLLQGGAVSMQPVAGVPGKFLTAAEYALLDELTELIIPADDHSPGARVAAVAAYIDGRLAESLEPDWQARWRSGLQAVDGLSRELNAKPFLEATPDQRVAVLTRMAAGGADPHTAPERFLRELKGGNAPGDSTFEISISIDQVKNGIPEHGWA